jgi:hypothetical protein
LLEGVAFTEVERFIGDAVFTGVAGFTAAARSIAVVWFVAGCITAPPADTTELLVDMRPIRHARAVIMVAASIAVACIAAVLPIEVASTAEEASTGAPAESLTIVAPAVEEGRPVTDASYEPIPPP